MVLVDRSVVFVDELDEVIKELGGLPLRESMNSALIRAVPPDLSDDELREWQYTAKEQVWARHAKLEEEAFDILIERKVTTHPCAARNARSHYSRKSMAPSTIASLVRRRSMSL
jgi:isochorismate hydrolase